jgi:purine-binding chemotaxis protein CheW
MHVRVCAGGEHYALAVESVRELRELGDLSPVPGAPAGVLGVTNLRGEVLPVLALADLLGLRHAAQPARLVVVEDAGRRGGLAVDELVDVGPLSGSRDAGEGPFLEGAVLVSDALVGLIGVGPLLDATETRSPA